jgi:exonuclease SbcD
MGVRGLRFAHLGDVHLGSGFTYLSREQRRMRQRELQQTFTRVMEEIALKEVDLVLISGDLLEYDMADKSLMRLINDGLAMVHCPVVMIAGNHDPLLPDSPYLTNSWPENVHLFQEEGWQVLHLKDLNAAVVGLSYQVPEDKLPRLTSIPVLDDPAAYKIVLVHGSYSEIEPFSSPYIPITKEQLQKVPVDYVALGHYHNFQIIHDASGQVKGCYPGSPEPLDFSETGLHGFVLGEILPNNEVEIQLVPMSKRQYFNRTVDISGSRVIQDIRDRIQSIITEGTDDLWSLELSGELDADINLDFDWLLEELKEQVFFMRLRSQVVPTYNLEELKKRPGVVAYFISYMEGVMEQAETDSARVLARKAMNTGLDALLKGEVKKR